MKKKIRRGGRARHPKLIQDAKIVSKNQDEKKDYAHIKCFKYEDMGHFASRCPTKLDNIVLRKDGDGTSIIAIAKHPATHTKAMPKYVAPNLREPKVVWVPSKSG